MSNKTILADIFETEEKFHQDIINKINPSTFKELQEACFAEKGLLPIEDIFEIEERLEALPFNKDNKEIDFIFVSTQAMHLKKIFYSYTKENFPKYTGFCERFVNFRTVIECKVTKTKKKINNIWNDYKISNISLMYFPLDEIYDELFCRSFEKSLFENDGTNVNISYCDIDCLEEWNWDFDSDINEYNEEAI